MNVIKDLLLFDKLKMERINFTWVKRDDEKMEQILVFSYFDRSNCAKDEIRELLSFDDKNAIRDELMSFYVRTFYASASDQFGQP